MNMARRTTVSLAINLLLFLTVLVVITSWPRDSAGECPAAPPKVGTLTNQVTPFAGDLGR